MKIYHDQNELILGMKLTLKISEIQHITRLETKTKKRKENITSTGLQVMFHS